jgi:hypothetical protein
VQQLLFFWLERFVSVIWLASKLNLFHRPKLQLSNLAGSPGNRSRDEGREINVQHLASCIDAANE